MRAAPAGVPKPITQALAEHKTPRERVWAPFTRHPKLLVRIASFALRACTRWVLGILVTHADAEGRCWVQVPEIRRLARRSKNCKDYSKPSILRGLRELHAEGLLTWERILPGGEFPGRGGKEGRVTKFGGRLWLLDLPALYKFPTGFGVPRVGTNPGGARTDRSPMIDRRSITHDRSSDPLCLPPEDLNDHAPSGRGSAAAAPPKEASETPGARDRAGQARGGFADAWMMPAAAGKGSPARRRRPRTSETERAQQGDGRGDEAPEREPAAREAPATVDELLRGAWVDLERLGIARNGAAAGRNRPEEAPETRPATEGPRTRQRGGQGP